ncbi:MAG: DUF3291 domain-containing protein [Ignavibacteria bacterium]|nr:DUF3291 domain-containing protein [Ignavibacteria bacterium]
MKDQLLVTVTSIRLKSVWYFFRLSLFGLKISRQAKSAKGFIKMEKNGFGYDHFTLSVWESEEDINRFARSGKHLEAMRQTGSIASEVRSYTFRTNTLPGWNEVKKLLNDKGKIHKFK